MGHQATQLKIFAEGDDLFIFLTEICTLTLHPGTFLVEKFAPDCTREGVS